eukprot:TRINITY_DN15450_c0_g1_i1.p1 TRINITY_DN15450_c0_g1~~TRINITY_DN15450_c0_g1_i1.p1  ORF type:complete len:221 (+),score=40.45 TRINITY_DN15450_c0_g1_i1:93-755(+)
MNLFQCLAVSFLCGVLEIDEIVAKDYYKTLGVSRKATDKEIKKAFRSLALVYHPDKSSEPNAEEKFLEIAEAYEVLGDPEKRRQYDQVGPRNFSRSTGYKPGNFDDVFKDFDDLFKDMNGHHSQHFKQHFGSHKFHHDQARGGGGAFNNHQFGQDIKFEDMFDSPFLNFHDFEDISDFHVNPTGQKRRTKNRRRAANGGQSCRTVTQRVGNTVTTFTQCS